MDVTVGRPAPALQPLIARYVGYRFEGFAPGFHQGLPSRYMTVIISLDAPVDLRAMPDAGQRPGSFMTTVGGLHAVPATIAHDGTQIGISVDLAPLGARRLFGLPAGALGSTVVELGDLLGSRAAELVDRLVEADGWADRFAILDDVLVRSLAEASQPAPEVVRAWKRLVTSGGAVEIGRLAEEVAWSRRHLSQRFQAELGLSPKVAARVLRFDRAVRLLRRPQRPGLAEVAVACGYADQAHLNRDWRRLAGCTPTRWLAEELPNTQDAPAEPAAS